MNSLLLLAGRSAGLLGILMCAVAVAGRLSGSFWIGGLQLSTLLLGGVAALAIACFLMLWVLTQRR